MIILNSTVLVFTSFQVSLISSNIPINLILNNNLNRTEQTAFTFLHLQQTTDTSSDEKTVSSNNKKLFTVKKNQKKKSKRYVKNTIVSKILSKFWIKKSIVPF